MSAEVPVVGHLNAALVADGALALQRLRQRTGMKQVDIVNRALQLFEYVDAQQRAGSTVLLRAEDGSLERLRFL